MCFYFWRARTVETVFGIDELEQSGNLLEDAHVWPCLGWHGLLFIVVFVD